MIIVNVKTYKESIKILSLVKKLKDVWIAVSPLDVFRVKAVHKHVGVQHVDAIEPGRNTGSVLPESAKAVGATFTLLNHSEHRLKKEEVIWLIKQCKKIGLKTVVCVKNAMEAKLYATYRPNYIAIEPPSLIGGKVSVTSAKPSLISDVVAVVKGKSHVLAGAGVHTAEDMRIAKKLGCKGVLLASGVVTSKRPEKVIKDLLS